MNVVAAIVLVLVPGIVPALALTRSVWMGGLMTSVVCVVTAGVAGIACVLLRFPIIPCALVLFVVVNAVSLWILRFRRRHTSSLPSRIAGSDSIGMLLFVLCTSALVVRPPAAVAWDARSIWWFHASWFQAGGDVVVDAMRNPILTFGHPEYPPGVPAFIGTVWALFGGENLALAMEITAVWASPRRADGWL